MIAEKLRERVSGLESTGQEYKTNGDLGGVHRASPADIRTIARTFAEAGYHLEFLTCLDVRAEEKVFRIVYQFNSYGTPDRHRVSIDIQPEEAAPSIAGILPAANWYEREVYDMFGVRFDGHPNLIRILTEEGCDYHPLLKDFVAHNQYSDSSGAPDA